MAQRSLDAWGDEEASGADIGNRCLSFEVRGPWAHFRRVEGNIVKQTYRLIPRTTVAGLVAAMLGLGRDSYYDAFARNSSKVAIEPIEQLRTMNLPQNTLSTAKEHLTTVPSRGHARISFPDPTELRQQHNYEVLVEPAYRIDLQLANGGLYRTLRQHLEDGTSHYVPSLGLSEHLAEVEYLGEFDVEPNSPSEKTHVDSAVVERVDSVELERDVGCRVERSPGYMEATNGGRTTTGFVSYAFSPDAESLFVHEVETYAVDGRTVMFS
jgi:CRISPR-associated protein Cas5h